MSKGNDQGPGAGAFEAPSKTGWLYKHGGSGMSSHWRKRWFVADHHYLFYYKGPNDKKPVGIVCLPEYESCHKTEGKVWKKQNTFMLDRGNSAQEPDSPDGASAKNYVLYADSEEEMLEWIKALTEEIKPMIGENPYANGFGGGGKSESTKGSKSKQKKSKGDTVDDKALDDVTAMAGEGPKLTHLTTSRPKVPRGRRPPKRYAVFHEDDSNPEAHESPSESPDQTKTSDTSPSLTPGESPQTQRKKGHKPTVALIPSVNRTMSVKATPKTPPTPPAKVAKPDTPDVTNAVESESPTSTTPPLKPKFAKPLPPKKPAKEKPEVPAVEPSEPPSPSGIQRPTPPIKPAKESKEEKAEPVVLSENVTKPSPVKKPRPQPPVKRRTSSGNKPPETTAAPTQVADSAPQPAVRPMPAPRPVPRKRVLSPQHVKESTQVIKEEVETKEEAKPTTVEEPVAPAAEEVKAPTTPTPTTPTPATPTPATPTPTTPTTPAPKENIKPPAKEEVVEPEKPVKQVEVKTASEETVPPIDVQVVEKPVEPVIPEKPVSKEAAAVKTEADIKESKVLPDVSKDVAAAGERASEKPPEKEEEKKEEISEVKSTAAPEGEKEGEEVLKKEVVDVEGEKEKEKKEKAKDEDTYEDMDMGEDKDNSQQPTDTKKGEEYENMTFNGTEEGTEKEMKKDDVAKTAAAEHSQQRVAPGKVNQYDEVAGDFLPYNPTEPAAAAAKGAVAPGRINQYDEVAGDFLPLNYSKPKVASPSSASAQDRGPSVVAPRVPPGYEIMGPAAPALVTPTCKPPSPESDYVPMIDGVMIDPEVVDEKTSSEKHEYEWIDKDANDFSLSSRPGEVSKTDHDAASKSLVSSGSHDDTHLAPETSSRQSVASSSGSTSWDVTFQFSPADRKSRTGSGNELTVAGLDGEEGRRRGSSGASKKSGDGSESTSSQLHRDSLGYTKIKQDRSSVDRVNSVTSDYDRIDSQLPPEIIPMATAITEEPRLSIPETLQQAKEILRLAKVVKAEAEQMRQEARKELTLAKKDRHDAMLMKKNAAEILRMAKERLGSSTK